MADHTAAALADPYLRAFVDDLAQQVNDIVAAVLHLPAELVVAVETVVLEMLTQERDGEVAGLDITTAN